MCDRDNEISLNKQVKYLKIMLVNKNNEICSILI